MDPVPPEKALQDFKEGLCTKLVSFQKGKRLTEYSSSMSEELFVYE